METSVFAHASRSALVLLADSAARLTYQAVTLFDAFDIRQEPEIAYAAHCREADVRTAAFRDCLSYYNGEGNAEPFQVEPQGDALLLSLSVAHASEDKPIGLEIDGCRIDDIPFPKSDHVLHLRGDDTPTTTSAPTTPLRSC